MKCKWCNICFDDMTPSDPIVVRVSAEGVDEWGHTINIKFNYRMCPTCWHYLAWFLARSEVNP